MQKEIYSIAIDGPAGSGKSTIAKMISKYLNIEHIDTGAMYRALTWKILHNRIDPKDREKIIELLKTTKIDFKDGNIYLDNKILNDEIRLSYISKNVSSVAMIPEVREKMVELQKEMSQNKNVVMDGRDIGTAVLSDSKYKYFLTATIEERALRRHKELYKDSSSKSNLREIKEDIKKRDNIDSTRKVNPLKIAKDAILIDTTKMTLDEVVETIISSINRR
ncbi:MAG: (d)CMP kinase [Tissierella sp.]|uniref:(d)CMP kinase n=1 Tax=Tissierella sp. TaxID=41274 RepID=UPI003F95C356